MKRILTAILPVVLVLSLSNCKKDETAIKATLEQKKRNTDAVAAITPEVGVVYGAVTIKGDFGPADPGAIVKFNGTNAILNNATDTSIVVTIPEGSASGLVTATVNGVDYTIADNYKILQLSRDLVMNSPIAITKMAFDRVDVGTIYATDAKTIYKLRSLSSPAVLYTAESGTGIINIATDKNGNVYAARSLAFGASFDVVRIDPSGNLTQMFRSKNGNADGHISTAKIPNIIDMVIAYPSNNMYVIGGFRIRRITPNGDVSTRADYTAGGWFDNIKYLAVDDKSYIYTAYAGVVVVSPSEGYVIGIAGSRNVYQPIDGDRFVSAFSSAGPFTVDNKNQLLFVSDYNLLRIVNTGYYTSTYKRPDAIAANGVFYDNASNKLYLTSGNKLARYSFK
ncbi:MAG: hypothetical protein EOP47_22305 [Sphingobacteriaceae bacterium]|nr:MAG: hypothetical protein EOP47_22305 [Sphingobacteriaceae bacterium]